MMALAALNQERKTQDGCGPDRLPDVGSWNSISVGTDGLGIISYCRDDKSQLKVAHCSDALCTSATLSLLDSGGCTGGTSITVGADGLGVISYHDTNSRHLKVAHCDNVTCTTAVLNTIDSSPINGSLNSIVVGMDGLPLISYAAYDTGDLKTAHCSNTLCIPARWIR